MRHNTEVNRSLVLKILRIFVIVYFLIAFPALLFISQEFGFPTALVATFILGFPVYGATRIQRSWPTVLIRELVFVSVLAIVAAGGCSSLVWRWYEIGLDQWHSNEMEFARAIREIQEVPTFRGVELGSTPKGQYFAHGSVESQERLDELNNRLAAQHIQWNVNIDLPGTKPGSQAKVEHVSMPTLDEK